ncbi:MAG: hypothetical protein ABJG88_10770 [Litorimonas sp.]
MSDISKKILSLEPDVTPNNPAGKDSIIRSIDLETPTRAVKKPLPKTPSSYASDIPSLRGTQAGSDDFPDFITRSDAIIETNTNGPKARATMHGNNSSIQDTSYRVEPPKTTWIMWTGITLTFIWIGAVAALYFGVFGAALSALTPMALSGLILATLLPAILITMLWLTWRRLAHISYEAGRVAHAAQILTQADKTALANTRSLAVGIQSEMSILDEQLAKMLSRFEALKTDITAHGQDINAVGLTLTERSDDVGRNLTLQRQALESITGTFDTRMETLGTTIETQSAKLSEVTQNAAKHIETAEETLTKAAQTLDKTGQDIHLVSQDTAKTIQANADTLTANHENLSELHEKITELVKALTIQQDKVKQDLAAQSENLHDMSNMAKNSTDMLQQNLSLGSDLLSALSTTNQSTQDTVQQQFSDMKNMLEHTQERADELAQTANNRVKDSLSQTRKDLSKLETDMQVLSAQISNAREQNTQLELGMLNASSPNPSGTGRLKLKPLETDFPPVEPPRSPYSDKSLFANETQPVFEDDFDDNDLHIPINLGADMEIANPDAELTEFDPDLLRPASPTGRGFGKSQNTKEKSKHGWRWRDMLGGLDRPDHTQNTAAPLTAPPLGETVVNRLTSMQLSPAALVDEGTVIEAAKARLKTGPASMLSIVETRLPSPIAHLRSELAQDNDFQNTAKSFVTQYGQIIAQVSPQDNILRGKLGTSEGRAYLICAAALS